MRKLKREIDELREEMETANVERGYCPLTPTAKQKEFLDAQPLEVFYGGGCGGGKSCAVLMAALQYVDRPGYSALLLRRAFSDLRLPGALVDLSLEWLSGSNAKFDGVRHTWRFPSGAVLQFGFLESENDKYRYQSSEFSYIGWDELSQFSESQYLYLFSRLRRRGDSQIPLRMRSASNPGGTGHEWVRARFIDSHHADRLFIPALLEDNPHLDRAAYEESLRKLDPVTRAQLRHGDWSIRPEGNLFKRQWFDIVRVAPPLVHTVRAWDFAASEAVEGHDPDHSVGVKVGVDGGGTYYVCDVVRTRSTPYDVECLVKQCAQIDGKEVTIRLEEEPGSSGKTVVDHYQRNVLLGFACVAEKATGQKVVRAMPFSAACEQRRVKVVAAHWNAEFVDELCGFPQVGHDDQVDAATNAFDELTNNRVELCLDWSHAFASAR